MKKYYRAIWVLVLFLCFQGCATDSANVVTTRGQIVPPRIYDLDIAVVNSSNNNKLILNMSGSGIGRLKRTIHEWIGNAIFSRIDASFKGTKTHYVTGLTPGAKACDLIIYFDARLGYSPDSLYVFVRGEQPRFRNELFSFSISRPFQVTRTESGKAASVLTAMLTLGVGGIALDEQMDKRAIEKTRKSLDESLQLVLNDITTNLNKNSELNLLEQRKREPTPPMIAAESDSVAPPEREPSKFDDYFKAVVTVRSLEAFGSGFFISPDGLIISNYHVIKNDKSPAIRTFDGRNHFGKLISFDIAKDIALIKIDVRNNTYIELRGIGMQKVGSEVIAIGAPMALDYTVSKGIISAKRQLEGYEYIQTDAAINSGSSGGPLISLEDGKLVGLITMGIRKDISEGLNFALSRKEILEYINSVRQ